jgi:hypothetical protein
MHEKAALSKVYYLSQFLDNSKNCIKPMRV